MARIKKPYRTEAFVRMILDPNETTETCPQCRERKVKFLFGTVAFEAGKGGEDIVKWSGKFCSIQCQDEWMMNLVANAPRRQFGGTAVNAAS